MPKKDQDAGRVRAQRIDDEIKRPAEKSGEAPTTERESPAEFVHRRMAELAGKSNPDRLTKTGTEDTKQP